MERHGNSSAPAFGAGGRGDYLVEAIRQELEHYVDAGGVASGGFADSRLVGIGVFAPHVRPRPQLAFIHVTQSLREGQRSVRRAGLVTNSF